MNVRYLALLSITLFVATLGCDRDQAVTESRPSPPSVPPAPAPVNANTTPPPLSEPADPTNAPALAEPRVSSHQASEKVEEAVTYTSFGPEMLKNPDFSQWDEASNSPKEWRHGIGHKEPPSFLTKVMISREEDTFIVRQTWERSDAGDSVFRAFGQLVEGLEKDTEYMLTVSAVNRSQLTIQVTAWEVDAESGAKLTGKEKVTRLDGHLDVTPSTSASLPYRGAFKTRSTKPLLLVARMADNSDVVLPGQVDWMDWSLSTFAGKRD